VETPVNSPDPTANPIRTGADWQVLDRGYGDVAYETAEGIAKITICRPEVRNAFRPTTLFELQDAFEAARNDPAGGVIVLTGQGHEAFCSGGDQRIRGDDGYVGPDGIGRLNVLDLGRSIFPKPWWRYRLRDRRRARAAPGATDVAMRTRAGQTPRVGSFDGGYGASYLARIVGQKKAREIWFLCRQYDAQQALDMGLVNEVVPLAELEATTVQWCREMLELSPLALRMIKASMNAADDGLAGIQQLAGDATLLYYMSEEAQEGRDSYVAKRKPDFGRFPKRP
jgi:naphthoate synthase